MNWDKLCKYSWIILIITILSLLVGLSLTTFYGPNYTAEKKNWRSDKNKIKLYKKYMFIGVGLLGLGILLCVILFIMDKKCKKV